MSAARRAVARTGRGQASFGSGHTNMETVSEHQTATLVRGIFTTAEPIDELHFAETRKKMAVWGVPHTANFVHGDSACSQAARMIRCDFVKTRSRDRNVILSIPLHAGTVQFVSEDQHVVGRFDA